MARQRLVYLICLISYYLVICSLRRRGNCPGPLILRLNGFPSSVDRLIIVIAVDNLMRRLFPATEKHFDTKWFPIRFGSHRSINLMHRLFAASDAVLKCLMSPFLLIITSFWNW